MSFGPQASASDEVLSGGPEGRRSKILGGGQADGRRSAVITTVSAILIFGGLGLVILNSPGWPKIQAAFFNREVFLDTLPAIAAKFWRNVLIFIVVEFLVLALALLIAVVRSLPGPAFAPLRWIAIAFTDIFRGVPTIVVVIIFMFGMPALELEGFPEGVWGDLMWGVIALTLVYSAFVSEVYRAGIESVHPSQSAAARSLGLSRSATMRYVVLPQAVRRVIPPLLNDFISLQKDTALLGIGGYLEVLRQAQLEVSSTFNFTPFISVALLYLIITIPMTRYVDWLVGRQKRRRQGGGAA